MENVAAFSRDQIKLPRMAARDDSSDSDGEREVTRRLQRGVSLDEEVRRPVGVSCLFSTKLRTGSLIPSGRVTLPVKRSIGSCLLNVFSRHRTMMLFDGAMPCLFQLCVRLRLL